MSNRYIKFRTLHASQSSLNKSSNWESDLHALTPSGHLISHFSFIQESQYNLCSLVKQSKQMFGQLLIMLFPRFGAED